MVPRVLEHVVTDEKHDCSGLTQPVSSMGTPLFLLRL